MKRVVMAVYDTAAEVFGTPFFVAAVNVGIRSFSDEVNRGDSENPLNKHPEDYSLYELGHFDDVLGTLEACDPRMVMRGKDVKLAP